MRLHCLHTSSCAQRPLLRSHQTTCNTIAACSPTSRPRPNNHVAPPKEDPLNQAQHQHHRHHHPQQQTQLLLQARPDPSSFPTDPPPSLAGRARALLLSTLSSCALLLGSCAPLCLPALSAESVTIKFPASRNPEIRSAQEVLVQAWGYVREYYVDPTFNKQDWNQKLQDALAATFRATSRDEALAQVNLLLGSLGDPFTRVLLPGGASEAFEAMKQAKIMSTGLLVGRLGSPDGPLVVSYIIEGSPAAEAGLREGDELVAVNGQPVWALRGEEARSLQDLLRQDAEVQLKVRRPAGQQTAAATAASGSRLTATAAARRAAAAAAAVPTAPAQSDQLPALPVFAVQAPDPVLVSDPSTATGEGAAEAADGLRAPASESSPSSDPPGEPPSASYQLPGSFFNVVLRPAPVEYVPVQYAVLGKATAGLASASGLGVGGGSGSGFRGGAGAASGPPATGASSAPSVAPSPSRVGYIRIVAFTEGVGSQVESAVRTLQAEGCGSWLLDLRSNPGGIVGEGLSVAELLLRPGQVFALVRDRSGLEHEERLPDQARALVEGQPLAVLVDRYSASTAELLAGALHDDAAALLLGQRTYGKGRTQQVVPLNGGVTLLVSTDIYVTPGRRPVDKVGLVPDVACRPGPPPSPSPRAVARAATIVAPSASAGAAADEFGTGGGRGSETGAGEVQTAESLARGQVELLGSDACVRAAVGKLTRGSVAPTPRQGPLSMRGG